MLEKEIIEYLKNNEDKTINKISKEINVSKDKLKRLCKENGIKVKQCRDKLSESEINYIIDNCHLASVELSKILDIKPSTIRGVWQRYGVDKDKRFIPNKEEFLSLYNKSQSTAEMANYYKVDRHTILNYLHKLGIGTSIKPLLNEEERKYIVNSYYDKTSTEVAKEFNVSSSYVYKIWKDAGLKGKVVYQYPFDQDYFESIDTPDKAYWLGWLASDGGVYNIKNKYLINIGLHKDDDVILKLFKKYLQCEKPLYYQKDKPVVTLQLVSKKMFDDLKKYNITERKTWTYTPVILEHKLMNHFIRGYFDGDGSIFCANNYFEKPSHYGVQIVGNYNAMQCIYGYLNENNLLSELSLDNRDKYKGNFGVISFTNTIKKYNFLKWIYKDCEDLYLPRKKILADKLIFAVENNLTNKGKTNSEAIEYYKNYIMPSTQEIE